MRVRIQALPQELQDIISDHVIFSTAPKTTLATPNKPSRARRATPAPHKTKITPSIIRITKDYNPPASLHIDHATRVEFAQSYYGDDIFEVVGAAVCLSWLRSLTREHRDMFKVVRFKKTNLEPQGSSWDSEATRTRSLVHDDRRNEIKGMLKSKVFREMK